MSIANNNPGNLRPSGKPWHGQIGIAFGFCVFDDAADGIRALCKQLVIYDMVHLCDTVREIISRWAPPMENDTAAYIADVCTRMKVGPDDKLAVTKPEVLASLATAIIWHENGRQPYAEAEIMDGVNAALT